MRTSNPNILNFQEVQLFINGDNKASNTKIGNTLFSTAGVYQSVNLPLSTINDGVLTGNSYFHSGSAGSAIGRSFGINFNEYFSKYDMESVVVYNRSDSSSLYSRAIGCRIELLNTNDNVRVSSSEISSGKTYYRFDGDRIGDATLSSSGSTTAVINNSSNTESLTEVADLDTLDYLFSKVRVMRTSNLNYLNCHEIQLFINGVNKASNSYSVNTLFTTGGEFSNDYLLDNINDDVLIGASGNENVYSPRGDRRDVGNNFGINFNNYFSKYDIESVVYYNWNSTNVRIIRAIGLTIELLNKNDNVRVSSSEISSGKLYYRFDGPRIGDATLSSSASTTAVINDSSNTESLTEVTDLSTLDYLFSKMRLIRTQDNIYNIRIKELQLFINGENKASNTKFGLSYINTAGESNATNDITKINDNNVAYSDTNFISSSTDIGISVGINFNSYFSKYDIEAIVYYNLQDGVQQNNSDGLRFELLNVNDNIRFSSTSLTGKKFVLYSGPRIGDATTVTGRSSTQIIDMGDSQMEYPTEVADLGTLNYLFSKVRLMCTSNPNYFNFRELQLFINGDNKASDTNVGNTVFRTGGVSNGRNVDRVIDGDLSGSSIYHSLSLSIGDNCGVNFNTYFSKYDIESIVIYNRGQFNQRLIGVTIELLNTNDNVRVSSTEISLSKSYYRFDGPRISDGTLSTSASTTAVINDSSNTESLTEVADLSTLDYLFSKVRVIRTSNPNYLQALELQMFIAGDNKLFNANYDTFTTATTNAASGGVSMINNNDFTNNTANTFLSGSIHNNVGLSFGVNFNNSYFSKYDIESIVFYSRGTVGFNREVGLRIELLNTNNNIRVSSSEISSEKLYYRFDGDRIGDATLSSSASTIAVIDDSSNTESLSAYSINVITNLSNIVLYLDAANTNSYPGTGTTWTDLSGQSNNGTLINGPTYNSGNGGSLVFDGSNDYVSETSALSDSFLQGNWTISFWVNFDSIDTSTSGSTDRILLHHGSSAGNKGLHLVQRNSRIRLGLYSNDLQSSATVSVNTWYHITFTLNNTTRVKQIFINGSLDNSHTGSGAYTGTGSNTRIGGKVLTFGQHFDGKMSSVIAYSGVLTSSEIANNFDAFKGRYGL